MASGSSGRLAASSFMPLALAESGATDQLRRATFRINDAPWVVALGVSAQALRNGPFCRQRLRAGSCWQRPGRLVRTLPPRSAGAVKSNASEAFLRLLSVRSLGGLPAQ